MAMSGACATCRLRAIIQHHSVTRQRRQWISCSPLRRQDGHETEYVDSLYQKFDRSLNQPKRSARAQRSGRYKGASPKDTANESIVRGRYSGRPIPQQAEPDGHYSGEASQRNYEDRRRQSTSRDSRLQEHSPELLQELSSPASRQPARSIHRDRRDAAVIMPNHGTEGDHTSAESLETEVKAYHLKDMLRLGIPKAVAEPAQRFMSIRDDDQSKWVALQQTMEHVEHLSIMRRLAEDKYFGRKLFYWTLQMTDAFVASTSPAAATTPSRDLPRPSVLLHIRTSMTDAPNMLWPYTLWALAKHVGRLQVAGDEASQAAAQQGMQELMTVWSLCMKVQQQRGRDQATVPSVEMLLDTPPIDFSFLPDATAFRESLQERGSSYSLSEVLAFVVPPVTLSGRQQWDYDFPSAALVTLDLLRNWRGEKKVRFDTWAALMETVVQCANVKGVPLALRKVAAAESESEDFKKYLSGVIDKFELRDPRRKFLVSGNTTSDGTGSGDSPGSKHPLMQSLDRPPALTESSTEFDRFVVDAARNLGRALEQNKLVYAQRTWQNIQQNVTKYQSVQVPRYLYELLLTTFIALRDQGTVIELWQAMVKDRHQPDVKTYSIVMQGCRHVGNAQMLEAFWSNMRKAGLQPDSHAWSTRIFSLLKSRQIDAGLRALSEMSQEWIAAARQAHQRDLPLETKRKKKTADEVSSGELAQRYTEDINGVPRPNKVVMNSAVSALAAHKDSEIPKVLSWARSFGIEPDLTTYNALLNVAMRRGNTDEPLHILRRMEAKGIQADGTTWTVLLTALFEGGFLDDLEPAVQQERIMAFVTSLENANAATIDMKGYALLIDRLLKRYDNIPAADAVLKHMTARKIQPSPHIYTILMTSYFSADPPNLPAVDALWNSMHTSNAGHGVPLDAQFYDRMVEGYARAHSHAGSTKPMHMFLQRMWNEGKKPSWKALTCAVQALAERGEWERARGLVGKTRREVEASRAQGQRFGQREFWGMVVELGLLDGAEVPRLGR